MSVQEEIGTRWSAADLARALKQFPPTAEQTAVIEADLAPMLVIAGAGSGKTETMAAKVVYLVANRLVKPEHILGLTFTRKAAAELSDRIRQRLRTIAEVDQIDVRDQPRISTYNSYAAGIVRDHGLRLGVDPESVLISDAGRYQLAEQVLTTWEGDITSSLARSTLITGTVSLADQLAEHGVSGAQVREFLTRLIAEMESKAPEGRSKTPRRPLPVWMERWRTRIDLLGVVESFTAAKRARGVVDFADQVRLAATLAEQIPAVGQSERDAYRAVLLDEYQDTSIAQVQLLSHLFGNGSGHPVTAVGDPNQAIYGWRGAAAGTLLDFPDQFTAAGTPASVATLSTAWRNSTDILTLANAVAAPLREEGSVRVPQLSARPGADPGQVSIFYGETAEEEAAHIAGFLRALGWADPAASQRPSAAILARKRKVFTPIAKALAGAGIPYQITGLGGLLETPEVSDLWAALQVVHDPTRGDILMRLLSGPTMRIGPADLGVLSAWAKELAGPRPAPGDAGPGDTGPGAPAAGEAPAPREDAEQASIVEAVQHLPPPAWHPPGSSAVLTDLARSRLKRLAHQLRTIRALAHLPLPDVIAAAERILALDIEVLAYRPGSHARENLDEFAAVAATFTSGVDEANLGGFLAWLDVAVREERGLSTREAEPDPAAVQLMTVHAAKGLEWDAVIVAGMSESVFPSSEPDKAGVRRGTGWHSDIGALPYELRGDAAHLPSFDHEEALTHKDMAEVVDAFTRAEGARQLQEERRLAYVALTRARTHLLLTGCFWVPSKKGPNLPSVFLGEATRAGVGLAKLPPAPAAAENPLDAGAHPALWPPPASTPSAFTRPDLHLGLEHPEEADDPLIAEWYSLARLLLAERDAQVPQLPHQVEHLSASKVVAAARDPEAFARNQLRPIPAEPSVRARQGTRFHTWVEQHFSAPALVDWESLPGFDDDAPEGDLDELTAAFLASPWAGREPVALEADVETDVAGVRLRSRIDAVFTDPDGSFHIVDWKTGAAPRSGEEEQARMLQLLLYRLSWARAREVPLTQVRASFHYVAENLTVPAPDLTEAEILEELTRHVQGAAAP